MKPYLFNVLHILILPCFLLLTAPMGCFAADDIHIEEAGLLQKGS